MLPEPVLRESCDTGNPSGPARSDEPVTLAQSRRETASQGHPAAKVVVPLRQKMRSGSVEISVRKPLPSWQIP